MYYLISFNLMMFSLTSFLFSIISMNYKINYLMEMIILNLNNLKIEFIMYIDWMSMIFISTIFLISSMVILYSMEYMLTDSNIKRFMILILIFVLSMIFMIICPNLVSILLGWDGLGLSSYCLVIFYQNIKSMNSGLITILMNRFGDICILMSISLMIKFNSWNFLFTNKYLNLMISFLIFMAAITKSAQVPFATWLPLAMAAPTPVSSLVHSSTLVTAGVYLIIRFNNILNTKIMMFIMYISMFTMFMAGMNAIFEFDFKKIIALSTLSQLGLMIFILSLNLPKLSFFHLITHAMFKSLLFLCSGIIIHNNNENQDIRLISLNFLNMKFTNTIFNLASLSLCGLPFLTGFYSKDLIIEMFNMYNNNYFVFFIMYSSMLFTLMYSIRLIYFTSILYPKNKIFNFNVMNNIMYKSITILIMNSMIMGSSMNWFMFNSINLVFLNKFNKLLIFMNFIIMIPLLMLLNKIYFYKNLNYFLLKLIKFSFFLNFLYKKNKINLMKLNLNLIKNIDIGWLEFLTFNMFIKNFYIMMMKFNNNLLMNILLISIMILVILMI